MSITVAEKLAEAMPDASWILSEEPEMESTLHYAQLALLVYTLEWFWRERRDYFIGANLTIYFSREGLKMRDFRGPDFFLVKGTENRPRASWVVWEEGGRYPDLIIELLSTSTAETDRELKKDLYQNRFRTPEYFWFSPDTLEFKGFRLVGGKYHEIIPDDRGRRWSDELGLYLGVENRLLRYFTFDGELILTLQESVEREMQIAIQALREADTARQLAEQEAQRAEQEARRAEQEARRAEQEAQRAERLAARLREIGVDPEKI
ncbi:MAG: Uma2 family endonuclease [Blastocatellia bacterium]